MPSIDLHSTVLLGSMFFFDNGAEESHIGGSENSEKIKWLNEAYQRTLVSSGEEK